MDGERMYKRIIWLWVMGCIGVALASLLAASVDSAFLRWVLALPLVLAIGFLVFIVSKWRN